MKRAALALTDDSPGPTGAIRVMVADLPETLRGLVERSVAEQPDMVLVGPPWSRAQERVDLLLEVGSGVDVLVLGAPAASPPPGVCSHLLGELPDLRILVVAHDGEAAVLYWLGLRRRRLGRVSPTALLNGIRRGLAREASSGVGGR